MTHGGMALQGHEGEGRKGGAEGFVAAGLGRRPGPVRALLRDEPVRRLVGGIRHQCFAGVIDFRLSTFDFRLDGKGDDNRRSRSGACGAQPAGAAPLAFRFVREGAHDAPGQVGRWLALRDVGADAFAQGLLGDGVHDALRQVAGRLGGRDAAEARRPEAGDFLVQFTVDWLFVHASSIRRRVRSAWNMRDLTVPTGRPRISATSA